MTFKVILMPIAHLPCSASAAGWIHVLFFSFGLDLRLRRKRDTYDKLVVKVSVMVQQFGGWKAKSFAIFSAAEKPNGQNWSCSSAAKQQALKCNIIWRATAGDGWLTYLTTDETDPLLSPLAVCVWLVIWFATAHQLFLHPMREMSSKTNLP